MAIHQRRDIQAGPSHDRRQPATGGDLRGERPRSADPVGNGERLVGIGDVEQVVRH
jgi:hypothetical protein